MGYLTLSSTQIEMIIKTMSRSINPWLIILFGSHAKGRVNEESDIDLAFLTDHEIDEYQTFLLAQELADMLRKNVDCVNLYTASTVLQAQVVGHGQVLYCNDEARRKLYYIRAFKEYALLNEERSPILKKIKERGTVYG